MANESPLFDLDQHRTALHDYFAAQPNVIVAYLFGSHARGQAHWHSDIDIAILHEPGLSSDASLDLRLDVIDELMGLLASNDVDVIVLNQAPLALAYRVLRDGIVLFCRDAQTRILYQADTVSRYLDFKPFIERHEKAILERARKGELLYGYNPHRNALADYRQLREKLDSIP